MSRDPLFQKVDHKDPTPKYLQAREILIEAIRAGRLQPGAKLPSTKEFSAIVDVSLITAHKALEGLVESGWLRREVGRGTFVRDDLDLETAGQSRLAIGLLLGPHVNIDDYFHSTILNGLRQAALAESRFVEFFFHDHYDLRHRGRSDVAAMCVHPPIEDRSAVERLAGSHPTVVIGGQFPSGEVLSVDCDNVDGARQAVRHLLELGHRRFLVLSGPMNLSNARDRAEGSFAELRAHGVVVPAEDQIVSANSVVLDDEAARRVDVRLTGPDRPTAIIAGGFYLAMAAIQAAHRARLSIPGDVSIVGFDDPPSASLLDPPLTTVRQPLKEMACRAFEMLYARAKGTAEQLPSTQLPTRLIVRESTGPVRGLSQRQLEKLRVEIAGRLAGESPSVMLRPPHDRTSESN